MEKMNSDHSFIHSFVFTLSKYGLNIDGSKTLILKKIYPTLIEIKDGFTVVDRLGAPGDAIITANVIRCIKKIPSIAD